MQNMWEVFSYRTESTQKRIHNRIDTLGKHTVKVIKLVLTPQFRIVQKEDISLVNSTKIISISRLRAAFFDLIKFRIENCFFTVLRIRKKNCSTHLVSQSL